MNNQTPFTTIIDDFVEFKRTSGYKYDSMLGLLRQLEMFLAERGVQSFKLDRNIIDEWCRQRPFESRSTYSVRVSLTRQFVTFLVSSGYEAAMPESVRNARNNHFVPYIFSHDEINRILEVIDNLQANKKYNSKEIYPVLFRMLYGCGLRIGEALALKIEDVDLTKGILNIKHAKYDKKRLVPMSESLTIICRNYSDNNLVGIPSNEFFFRHEHGGSRNKGTVATRFKTTLWECGIPYMGKGKGPRLHDIRHTFCCHSFKQMSDNNIDLYCALPILSTYMGHATIRATERYLRLTLDIYPEMERKIEHFSGNIYPEVQYDE